jgi:hypothetical protein
VGDGREPKRLRVACYSVNNSNCSDANKVALSGGVLLGALITLLVSRYYYQRSSGELGSAAEELQRQTQQAMAATFSTYEKGREDGRRETDRSMLLISLTILYRDIHDARQAFIDQVAPAQLGVMMGMSTSQEKNENQEVIKKIDAIDLTRRSVSQHLTTEQNLTVSEIFHSLGRLHRRFHRSC